MKVVLGLLFLTISNVDIQFAEKKSTWRSYTIVETLPTIKWVELINKKKFVKVVLDENSETFLMHIAALEALLVGMSIHPNREAQIASLFTKKVTIPDKYFDFADVF